MTGQMLLKFSDPDGGFFDTPQDNVTPSGSALAAHTLLLFSAYDYNPEQRRTAEKMLKSTVMKLAARYPRAFSYQRSRF